MTVTGVLLASDVLGSVDAALRTFYGRSLLLKLGLVLVAGGCALVNHRHLRGRRDLDVPRRTLRWEAVLAVAVVGATAVLTSGQPATEPQLVRTREAGDRVPVAGQVADLQEAVSLRPNRPGANVAIIDVFDTRRPAPAPIVSVDVALPGGQPVIATPLSDGHWAARLAAVPAGPTTVTTTVYRSGERPVTSHQRWTVGDGRSNTSPALVSTAPLHAWLRMLGVLLGVVATVGWSIVGVRRRRSSRSHRLGAGPGSPRPEQAEQPAESGLAPAASRRASV
jgi:copper transport protein